MVAAIAGGAVGCYQLLHLGRRPALLGRLIEHGACELEVAVAGGGELGGSAAAEGAEPGRGSHARLDVCEDVSRNAVLAPLSRAL